jgi:hypothetical protein
MLQVASVSSGYYLCFTHMLKLYIPNVSSSSDVCCIQVFHVTNVCVSEVYLENHGGTAWGRGVTSWWPANGARSAPGVRQTGCAHPHPGSRVPPAWRERKRSGEAAACAGQGEADGGGVHY